MDGKRILYTGDINSTQTQLLSPIDPTEFPEIDAVITECTYGTIDHQNRIEIEDDLHKSIQDVIDNKGMVIIPAFGVGRSQEILMVLFRENEVPYPVILNGMARKVCFSL